MELSSGEPNPSESRFDDPALAFYYYTPVNSSVYSIGIKNLEEAALARELAELRLLRLLKSCSGKGHNNR